MRLSLGFRGPVHLRSEAIRGGLSLGLMLGLLLWGLAWWLVLILPLLAYAGLWLLAESIGQPSVVLGQRRRPRDDGDAAACTVLLREIAALAGGIDDPHAGERARRIVAWIERILGAMAEDGKERAATPLLDLTRLTADLLAAYVKLVRRGLDGAELRAKVGDNLATLEAAYERFWVRLNRDSVVDFESLGESIDFNLKELSASHGRGATP